MRPLSEDQLHGVSCKAQIGDANLLFISMLICTSAALVENAPQAWLDLVVKKPPWAKTMLGPAGNLSAVGDKKGEPISWEPN